MLRDAAPVRAFGCSDDQRAHVALARRHEHEPRFEVGLLAARGEEVRDARQRMSLRPAATARLSAWGRSHECYKLLGEPPIVAFVAEDEPKART